MMNADELAAIRERCEAATPGPHDVGVFDPKRDPVELFREQLSYGSGRVWLVWCPNHPFTVGKHPRPEHAVTLAVTGNGPNSENNAYWLSAAWQDESDLIAEVERLTTENARMRADYAEEIAEMNQGYDCAKAGGSVNDEPAGLKHDVWRCGFAWGAFDGLTIKNARLRETADALFAKQAILRRACTMAREELQFGGDWQGARAVIDAALRGEEA